MSARAPTGNDDELMARASAGSAEAFSVLYDRYSARAYRLAFAVCRDDGRAQDAVNDAFRATWNNRVSHRPQRVAVVAWLLTAVRDRAIDLERRHSEHAAHRANEQRLDGPAEDLLDQCIEREDAEHLRATLVGLPDAQQEVITLAFYGQLSHTEIAAALGLPSATVKGRMRLGMKKLVASLEETSTDVEPRVPPERTRQSGS